MIQHQVNNTREGVPGLGDIAIIGGLFSNRAKNITSTETVVLITPSIVNYTRRDPEASSVERVNILNDIIDSELLDTAQDMDETFDGDARGGLNAREQVVK